MPSGYHRFAGPAAVMIALSSSVLVGPTVALADCTAYQDHLHWAGSIATAGNAKAVGASGSFLYLSDNQGFHVVDISNPSSTEIVGTLDTRRATDITVSGSLVYATEGYYGLEVIDVSSPVSPETAGALDTPGSAAAVAVSGSRAYVVDGLQLLVVDVSNAASPAFLGSVDLPYYAYDLALSGTVALLTLADQGLQAIDVSNPYSPTILGTTSPPGLFAESIAVKGSFAYVASAYSGLQVFNVSNPPSFTAAGSVDTPGFASSVVVSDSLVFLLDDRGDSFTGLQMISVAVPSSPHILASVPTPGGATDVALSGSLVCVADFDGGVQVIDVPMPEPVEVIGSVQTPGSALGVAVGTMAYVADDLFGLHVVNVSNPANPTIAGSVDTPGHARAVALTGTFAYVADQDSGLQVVNVSSPLAPIIVGSVDTLRNAVEIATSGSRAYVADDTGLHVIDVSNPASPAVVGSVGTPDGADDVTVAGPYAYLAARQSGLVVVDVSNPVSPTIVGSLDTLDYASGVAVSGSFAYVTGDLYPLDPNGHVGALFAIDVSDPTSPRISGLLDTPLEFGGIEVSGSVAYTTDSDGLRVINVMNPASPRMIGSADLDGGVEGPPSVAIHGSLVYVAYRKGLSILPEQCDIPIPVVLTRFEAVTRPHAILLEWATSSGADLIGFHVLRSVGSGGTYERLTRKLIRAKGGSYDYLDDQVVPGTLYHYRLEALDRSGGHRLFGPVDARIGPEEPARALPRLAPAFPNPAVAGASIIPFSLPYDGPVELDILDTMGRRVRVLLDKRIEAGDHRETWDGRDERGQPLPAGVYFTVLRTDGHRAVRKLVRLTGP